MSEKIKVGLIVIADPRLKGVMDKLQYVIDKPKKLLGELDLEIIGGDELITTEDEAKAEAVKIRNEGAVGMVLNSAWFLRSNAMAGAATAAGLPVALWTIPFEEGGSAVGYGVSHGALDEMGIEHEVIFGPWEEKKKHMMSWSRAVNAKTILSNSRYGQIGGRCLEMMTGDVDNNQVKRIFGIDYDHMEQWDLIHMAEKVPDDQAAPFVEKWKKEFKSVEVSDEVLMRSAKVYLAGKKVVKDKNWTAFGIKCQHEFIDNYLAPCLPIGLWNDEGLVVACECDQNAAITMMTLNAISNQPVMFTDLSHIYFDKGVVRLLNCGVAPPSYAGGPENVKLKPCPEGQATFDKESGKYLCKGGACTGMLVSPGEGTIARFGRIKGEYVLHVTGCEIVDFPHDESIIMGFGGSWPFAYVKPEEPIDDFIHKIRAHHMCLAKGDWENELKIISKMMGIRIL